MRTTTLTFAACLLAGCTTFEDVEAPPVPQAEVAAAPQPAAAAPVVTAAGTSPISPGRQVAFCQDQVAYMYHADTLFATAGERVVAPDGSASVNVTINKDAGAQTYTCRLGADNRFIDVVAATGY